jgi:uncharacterized protein (DUF433 family)
MVAPVAEPVPLSMNAHGVMRVANTRVPLETVVTAFRNGATPEEIAQNFPVLALDDIYSVLTYCLRHPEEVESYMQKRRALADEVRQKVESAMPQTGFRERLLARLGR